jgi:predicted ATPase/tRNA A-37 threonylcarbamoyl transferase component Bud32
VGEYRITRRIGEGGMGTVYAAIQPLIGKTVAIKVLKPELCEDPTMSERFIAEARAVNTIGHENIVDIFSFGSLESSGLYYVMEFLKGSNLRQRLQEGPWLSGREAARGLPQVLNALAAAHGHGIVHRDLKPDNIFLVESPTKDIHIKLLDFGIAKFTSEGGRQSYTQTGAPLGTPLYMSPEQCQGETVGIQADLYSFGAILYELFTGRPPFAEKTLYSLILAHVNKEPAPPSNWARVPSQLDALILRCLAKKPEDRPKSARAVRGVVSRERRRDEVGDRIIGRLLATLAEQLRQVAGQVDAILDAVDETGFTLVLGLSTAGEEDASRAVALAQHARKIYQKECTAQGIVAPISLSAVRGTAEARRSVDGSVHYSLSHQLIARSASIAASAGEGQVGVDSEVYSSAQKHWTFEEIPAPGSRHDRLGRVIEFIMAGAIDSRPGLLLICGPKGIGKRTLIDAAIIDAAIRAHERDAVEVLVAEAKPLNFLEAHTLVSDVARRLLSIAATADGEVIRNRTSAVAEVLFSEQPAAAGRFVNALGLLFDLEQNPANPLSPDPEQQDQQLQGAINRLLRWRESQGRQVVVLINAHLAQGHSLEHLGRLFASTDGPTTHVVASTTEATMVKPLQEAFSASGLGVDVIKLGELDHQERMDYTLSRFAVPDQASQLAKHVVAKAGGSPFFINAVLETLVELGTCSVKTDDPARRLEWTGRESHLPELPSSVEDLAAAQIDRLSSASRSVLRHAALFGTSFLERHVETLLGGSVKSQVNELCEAGLLVVTDDRTRQLTFAYELAREVAYSTLPKSERPELHRRVAKVLASDRVLGEERLYAQIARHFELAGDHDHAADQYSAAARHAQAIADNKTALTLFDLALNLLDSNPHQRFEIHKGREELLLRKGDREAQWGEIQAMLQLSERLDDVALRATAQGHQVRYHQDGGEQTRVVELFDSAMNHAVDAEDSVQQAELLRLKARALSDLGRNRESVACIQGAFALCSDTEDGRRTRAELIHVRGNLSFYTGRISEAREDFLQAQVIFRELGLSHLDAVMHMNLGFLAFCLGDYEEALERYCRFAEICEEYEDKRYIGAYLANYAQCYLEMGYLDIAEETVRQGIEGCEQVDDISGVSDALATFGQVRLRQGRFDDAVSILEDSMAKAEQAESSYSIARAKVYLGYALIGGRGCPDDAIEHAREAIRISKDGSMPQGRTWGLSMESTALAATGRVEEAISRSTQALALLSSLPERVGVEEVLFNHAKLLLQAGRSDEVGLYLELATGEVQRKAELMKDPENQRVYLSSPPAADIVEAHHRLVGPTPDLDTMRSAVTKGDP